MDAALRTSTVLHVRGANVCVKQFIGNAHFIAPPIFKDLSKCGGCAGPSNVRGCQMLRFILKMNPREVLYLQTHLQLKLLLLFQF